MNINIQIHNQTSVIKHVPVYKHSKPVIEKPHTVLFNRNITRNFLNAKDHFLLKKNKPKTKIEE